MNGSNPFVMVTGASGFVGGRLALDLAAAGFRVAAVGGSRAPSAAVSQSVEVAVQCDLSSLSAVRSLVSEIGPDVVIHAAALARTADCEKDPPTARRANVASVRNFAEAGSFNFVLVSTDLVFEGAAAPKGGFKEEDQVSPRSTYAHTKVEAEQIALESFANANVARICLVYGNALAGSGGFLLWMRRSLEQGQSVKLFTDEWRTPIYTGDICRGIEALIVNETAAKKHKTVHFAGSDRISRFDFGVAYAAHFGFDASLICPSQQSDFSGPVYRSPDVSLCSKLLREEFGVKPLSIEEAFAAMS
ncbi:MAG: SDR family oxidoreductase [Bdellovibrionales bacterium]|nr:SDR family oxidoreductase [Bdellovibrionales bacterium]